MRRWTVNAIFNRDRDFLLFIGKLRGGKPKVSRGKKQPLDWHFLDWLMDQPCAICGRSLEVEKIQIAACHVARVGKGSGTGIKPIFNAVPGCNDCHSKQHQIGESAVGGKEQWDIWADEFLVKYVTITLLEKFGMNWERFIRDALCGNHPDFMCNEAEA